MVIRTLNTCTTCAYVCSVVCALSCERTPVFRFFDRLAFNSICHEILLTGLIKASKLPSLSESFVNFMTETLFINCYLKIIPFPLFLHLEIREEVTENPTCT